jgi:hypothetical protein
VSTSRPTIGGCSVALDEVVNEHFLARYRALLDEEDAAFDELEHAFEDGDREHFNADLTTWHTAISRKLHYLQRHGVEVAGVELSSVTLIGAKSDGAQPDGAGLNGASPAL